MAVYPNLALIFIVVLIVAIVFAVMAKGFRARKISEILLKFVGAFLVGLSLATWLGRDIGEDIYLIVIFAIGVSALAVGYSREE